VAILRKLLAARTADFVFPGGKAGRPLSNMALLALLRRMGRADLTVHGFRSAFRDWAAELTNFPQEVCEMALAHAIGDKVERAYRRGDLFSKRRQLMEAWSRYCLMSCSQSEVLPLLRSGHAE
jgi:integrase